MDVEVGPAAIELRNVAKSYRHYNRPIDRLKEVLTGQKLHVERRSVSDVNLEIRKGEVVGIIGRNGAGKSTLLKMIAGRLEPSSGTVQVRGSLAAILELGTGFHPDMSGRDNIRVGGLCLGLTRRQIENEMQSIIDFSELESVIDMPFRTYSTGMQARLTFATAVTVDPDILIIDEALSVGDNKFQMKSFNRIREFKERGKTILVVTHGMGSVTSFCDRAILMEQGKIIADGDPQWVTSVYHHLQFGDLDLETPAKRGSEGSSMAGLADKGTYAAGRRIERSQVSEPPSSDPPALSLDVMVGENKRFEALEATVFPAMTLDELGLERGIKQGYRYGDKRAVIAGVAILDANGVGPVRQLKSGQRYDVVLDCEARTPIEQLYAGILVRDLKGEILFGSDTTLGAPTGLACLEHLRVGNRRRVVVSLEMWLAAGDYFISGAVTAEPGRQSDMWFDAYEFTVVDTPSMHTNSVVNLAPRIAIIPLGDPESNDLC